MKIYVSGPISGYEEGNLPAFRTAERMLLTLGHQPVVPNDIPPWAHPGDCPRSYVNGPGHSAACFLRADLAVMLECHAVLMLFDWEASVGARLEHSVAAHCGMPIWYASIRDGQLTLPEDLPGDLFPVA